MTNQEKICMGEIVGPHGVKGNIRVRSFTAKPQDLFGYKTLTTDKNTSLQLRLVSVKKNNVFVAMVPGVTTCEDAEVLRGTKLFVNANERPALEEDEFYWTDLLGLAVLTQEQTLIGTVKRIDNYGAGDFLDISSPDGTLYTLPFTKESVPIVNLKDKNILINQNFLLAAPGKPKEEKNLPE